LCLSRASGTSVQAWVRRCEVDPTAGGGRNGGSGRGGRGVTDAQRVAARAMMRRRSVMFDSFS